MSPVVSLTGADSAGLWGERRPTKLRWDCCHLSPSDSLTLYYQVEQLVTSLNIQTGNMCQFLPQDVVKNFPLMSAQERFLNTVRAVGEGRLVDQFDKLKV